MLGSVYAVTDSTGTTQATWTYDVYGARTLVTGALQYPFGFTGREHDADTGLIYARQRYYDPVLGTWLQPDRLGMPDGPNRYQYVMNMPTNRVDHTGNLTGFIDSSFESMISLINSVPEGHRLWEAVNRSDIIFGFRASPGVIYGDDGSLAAGRTGGRGYEGLATCGVYWVDIRVWFDAASLGPVQGEDTSPLFVFVHELVHAEQLATIGSAELSRIYLSPLNVNASQFALAFMGFGDLTESDADGYAYETLSELGNVTCNAVGACAPQ